VQEPNWPDEAFTKLSSLESHLLSEVQDQIETWKCANTVCRKDNKNEHTQCAFCGWRLPKAMWRTKMVKGPDMNVDEEIVLRRMGDGPKGADVMFKVDRPTGPAPGGGYWIPEKKEEDEGKK
jgi:hypothetical protein